jgi:CheY-like chemotaxis protein
MARLLRGLERISLNCRYPHLRRLDVAKCLRTATMFKNRLSKIRIVIVDDHADTRNLLKLFLEHCGAQPTVASNGQEALEVIRKVHPDLLITDLAMPHMDGYELMEKVQDLEEEIGSLPSIVCSAYARAEDRARARKAGFNAHLEKPVDLDQLVTTILKVVNLPS